MHTSTGDSSASFERRAQSGREARWNVPRRSHGSWVPDPGRPDPVALLEEQGESRVSELVPIRYGRMSASPFAFYRGAALIMAADLAATPSTGMHVQLCGDAHLSNFGLFGTPERSLIFDINDFDETHPGPWEWDVKRLVASVEVAARQRGFQKNERETAVLAAARGYRERMRKAAESPVLVAWYDRLEARQVTEFVRAKRREGKASARAVEAAEGVVAKARKRDSGRKARKLVHKVNGELRIIADPPLIVPIEDLDIRSQDRDEQVRLVRTMLDEYQETLRPANHPMREFEYVHMARAVPGVGSVGTRAWIILLRGRDNSDILLIQAKEAQASVLERFLAPSDLSHHGERVVTGQRLTQAASDIFLGWQRVTGLSGEKRDFYIRQLHDWKGSIDPGEMLPSGLAIYAELCGETLARAHARTGDRVAIAAYLGQSDAFDQAMVSFASAYADQNDRDFAAFTEAIASGRLEALVL